VFNQPRTRAAQKAATAQTVLEAARVEFERVGFEAANIRAIAKRAGVSAGTVLHHHGDKRELLHAALFEDLDLTLRTAIAALGDRPIIEELVALTRAVFHYYETRPTLSRTLLKESLFADPPWAAKFAGQVRMTHAAIAKLVEQAIQRGELRREADPMLLGVTYFSFFYFALIAWVQGNLPSPTTLVERQLEQHLVGLRRRST
jgi:AcrR family transcriptional regulator